MASHPPHFPRRQGVLHAEDVSLTHLADTFGTPLYVYSRRALRDAWGAYTEAIGDGNVLVCFGMKANSNLSVLREFQSMGAGFDIVSGGELARVLAVGGDAGKVVFSGVGKQAWEMRAALEAGIKCFNVESRAELHRLADVAAGMGMRAPVSLRVNPDVDAHTHPYIATGLKDSKFGIPIGEARDLYREAASLPSLDVVGLDCHIGSQITDVQPYLDALDILVRLVRDLTAEGIQLHHLDIGGGLGIRYDDEVPPHPRELIQPVLKVLADAGLGHLQLVLEPGRSLVGNAGVLLTRVEYLKPGEARDFAIVDAAMSDLLRPTLYQAWHGIEPVVERTGEAPRVYDVVGPVCESGDWLGRERSLAVQAGDLLAVRSAGAYGFVMSSQYNTRPRAAEVLVDGAEYRLIRSRETVEALFSDEAALLPR